MFFIVGLPAYLSTEPPEISADIVPVTFVLILLTPLASISTSRTIKYSASSCEAPEASKEAVVAEPFNFTLVAPEIEILAIVEVPVYSIFDAPLPPTLMSVDSCSIVTTEAPEISYFTFLNLPLISTFDAPLTLTDDSSELMTRPSAITAPLKSPLKVAG